MEYPSLSTPPSGSIRFNTDSSKLEIYNGEAWWEINGTLGFEGSANSARWVTGGGYDPSVSNVIQYVQIPTTGNAVDFGNLTENKIGAAACASSTRGIFSGRAEAPADTDTIDYITISSTGNASDFGNLASAMGYASAMGDKTRGLICGGADVPSPYTSLNSIQYVTFSSTGNTTDFGDMYGALYNTQALSSPTRGIVAGGSPTPDGTNTIGYVTIQSTGNTNDFGDLITAYLMGGPGASNATRGMFGAGNYAASPTITAQVQYIEIATTGNAADFGDLTVARDSGSAGSSATRAVFGGGRTGPPAAEALKDTLDYVEIKSLGNGIDFGDLLAAVRYNTGFSNTNGGVQG